MHPRIEPTNRHLAQSTLLTTPIRPNHGYATTTDHQQWAWQDLNLRPTDYESAALTAELQARHRKLTSATPKIGSACDESPGDFGVVGICVWT